MLVVLVDGNNFYVSCERVFRPELERRPVIVLSNNDGCIVSRSNEAKALGVPMAEPFFKVRELVKREKIVVFSSNYPLYGDMSRRMNETLMEFSPDIEPYSIDESFVSLLGLERRGIVAHGRNLRATVRRWTGLPVSVGIGPTKTLAKLANVCAKKMAEFDGVCDLSDAADRTRLFALLPAREVWGVGHSAANTLTDLGIHTVADLCTMDAGRARRALNIVGSRLIWELRGEPCFTLETIPQPRKGVSVTRSFGNRITTFDGMREAVATFATRAAEKLREDGMAASHITVFMRTSHHPKPPHNFTGYANSRTVTFTEPTDDTRAMARAAIGAAEAIWKDGYRFAKAGVYLSDLVQAERVPFDLFSAGDRDDSRRLMGAIDRLNNLHSRNGRDAVFLATSGTRQHWRHRSDQRSPGYTTSFRDLRQVRA